MNPLQLWMLVWLSSVTPTSINISTYAIYADVAPMLGAVINHMEDYDSYRIINLGEYYKFRSDLSILLEKQNSQ